MKVKTQWSRQRAQQARVLEQKGAGRFEVLQRPVWLSTVSEEEVRSEEEPCGKSGSYRWFLRPEPNLAGHLWPSFVTSCFSLNTTCSKCTHHKCSFGEYQAAQPFAALILTFSTLIPGIELGHSRKALTREPYPSLSTHFSISYMKPSRTSSWSRGVHIVIPGKSYRNSNN